MTVGFLSFFPSLSLTHSHVHIPEVGNNKAHLLCLPYYSSLGCCCFSVVFFFFFLRISTFLEFFFHLIFTFYALHLQTLLHYFLYNHIRSLARINVMLVLQVLSHVTLYSCHSIFLPRFKSVYHMQS